MPPTRYRSDEQRKAMFARMGARGATGSWGSGGASGSWSDAPAKDGLSIGSLGRAAWERFKGTPTYDADGTPIMAVGMPSLGKTGLLAGTSLATGSLAGELGSYREAHPTLNPKTDHYLALGSQVRGCTRPRSAEAARRRRR